MSGAEFSLIDTYFTRCAAALDEVCLGIGDDAAVVAGSAAAWRCCYCTVKGSYGTLAADETADTLLVTSCASLIEHGFKPRLFTLAATLPDIDHSWLQNFSDRTQALCLEHRLALVGGDTSRGAFSLQVFVFGSTAT